MNALMCLVPNRNGKHPNICFDHLQRDRAHHGGRYTLGQYPCHGVLGDSQYFCLADEGSLRNEYMCGDVGSNGKESFPFASPFLPPLRENPATIRKGDSINDVHKKFSFHIWN